MEETEIKTYPQWIKDLVIKVWSEDIEPRNWSSFNSSAKYSENKRNTIMFAMGRVAEEAAQKERAEVRRDALREGFRLGTENANDRVWGAFRANLMTSSQINAIEKEVYRILNAIFEDIEEQSDWYCDSLVEHKERKAAEQGQGEGDK